MKFHHFICISAAILLLWFAGHIVYVVVDGLTDEGKIADVAVILGNKVNSDGSLSTRLRRRLECGQKLYTSGRTRKLLVSGSLGKEGFLEGDKMKAFLAEHGVPDSAIIIDNHGDNTLATVRNTLRMKDSLKYESLLVVSQYFHVTRTKMLFRKQHFTAVSSVSPRYFEARDAYALLREFVAYYTE